MRTETRTVYIAADGREYDTKHEARQAELRSYLINLFVRGGMTESIGVLDRVADLIAADKGMFISLVPGRKDLDHGGKKTYLNIEAAEFVQENLDA